MPSEALLGPAALLVAALIAIGVLWREHLKDDQDDRDQRNESVALLKVTAGALADQAQASKDQAAAWNRMVDTLERKIKADADRRRQSDRP